MVTNLFIDEMEDSVNFEDFDSVKEEQVEAVVSKEIEALINFLRKIEGTAILVTNEIGRVADVVYFCVSGIPMKVKGEDFFELD